MSGYWVLIRGLSMHLFELCHKIQKKKNKIQNIYISHRAKVQALVKRLHDIIMSHMFVTTSRLKT